MLAFVMLQRKERLETALSAHNLKSGIYDEDMQKSKKCKAFVANAEAGLPSDEDVQKFLVIIKKEIQLKIGTQQEA